MYILSSEYKYASAHEFELNMETTPLWLSAATMLVFAAWWLQHRGDVAGRLCRKAYRTPLYFEERER